MIERCIASHRSVEPGHAIVLETLGLRPLLGLDLRLGEGTGAALAVGLLASRSRCATGWRRSKAPASATVTTCDPPLERVRLSEPLP